MPITLRKLTGESAARYFPSGRGQQDVTEYLDALRGLTAGEIAEVELGDVTERAMKRRLTTAGKQLGLMLQYSKQASESGTIGFRVKQASGTPAPKRRGRPPKNAS